MTLSRSKVQIVATIGPASSEPTILEAMIRAGMDLARLNLSWGSLEEHTRFMADIRAVAGEAGREVPVIADLPGPRVQEGAEHSFDAGGAVITEADERALTWASEQGLSYVALSFITGPEDIVRAREILGEESGVGLVAKIERPEAVEALDGIIEVADAVMVARGDLGETTPYEELPFLQADITARVRAGGKPVITATEMLWSMTEQPEPTRAEVTDVAYAIMTGSDAVMLSEETARGKYPVEAVAAMERIVSYAERYCNTEGNIREL